MRKVFLAFVLHLVLAVGLTAAPLTEVVPSGSSTGLWYVASPRLLSSNPSSGTYYNPSVLERNGYAFLFAQGGQFSSPSPFVLCAGDDIVLWRSPLTNAAFRAGFTPLRRISRCDSNSQYTVHWTFSSAYYSTTRNKAMIVSERQQLDITVSPAVQVSSSVWLLEGTFNAAGDDIPTWTYTQLFATAPSVDRIESFSLTPDTSRTAPNDGYAHDLYRGFARIPFNSTVEWRIDISSKYCPTSAACALVEFKKSSAPGGWQAVANSYLDFLPDVSISSFRPSNIAQRTGQLELWGAALVTGNDCPCLEDKQAAQFRWYIIDPATFSLTGPSGVSSQFRCMPAEPHTYRTGVDIVVLSDGSQYLFSGQNDDAGCNVSRPFVGQDIVTTFVQ